MPYRVLGLVFSLIIVMYLDRLCIAVAGPRIQADLGFDAKAWGWVIGAFSLSYALFEVPTGMLADRIGPRRVITRIVLWWSVFTFATGLASGFRSMLLVRFLFGAGEAGAFPSAASVLSRWVPASHRGKATSIVWIATGIGGILTPLIVVPLQQSFGWRVPFFGLGILGVAWAGIWYSLFRDSPGTQPPRQHTPVPWRHLLRQRNFLLLIAMYHCYCWGGYFYLSWLPTYLQVGRGLTENAMKTASAVTAATGLLGTFGGGFLSDMLIRRFGLRVGRSFPASAGLIAGGLLLGFAAFTPSSTIAVASICAGLACMNLMFPISWAVCVDLGRQHAGAVSGSMNMAGQAGSLISSVAFGYMVTWFGGYNAAVIPLAAMLVISGLLYLGIDPRKPLFSDPPDPCHDAEHGLPTANVHSHQNSGVA